MGVDALIEEVWAVDGPPQDAPGALQALIGRLRRAIGRSAVESVAGGYRLVVEHPEDIDLTLFERLVDDGTNELRAGDALRTPCAPLSACGAARRSPISRTPRPPPPVWRRCTNGPRIAVSKRISLSGAPTNSYRN